MASKYSPSEEVFRPPIDVVMNRSCEYIPFRVRPTGRLEDSIGLHCRAPLRGARRRPPRNFKHEHRQRTRERAEIVVLFERSRTPVRPLEKSGVAAPRCPLDDGGLDFLRGRPIGGSDSFGARGPRKEKRAIATWCLLLHPLRDDPRRALDATSARENGKEASVTTSSRAVGPVGSCGGLMRRTDLDISLAHRSGRRKDLHFHCGDISPMPARARRWDGASCHVGLFEMDAA